MQLKIIEPEIFLPFLVAFLLSFSFNIQADTIDDHKDNINDDNNCVEEEIHHYGLGSKSPFFSLDKLIEDNDTSNKPYFLQYHVNQTLPELLNTCYDKYTCPSTDKDKTENDIVKFQESIEVRYVAVIARHGSRYPTKKNVAKAVDFIDKVCNSFISEELFEHSDEENNTNKENVKEWCKRITPLFNNITPASLVPLGKNEMEKLARIIDQKYMIRENAIKINTKVTTEPRTKESCESFFKHFSKNKYIEDSETENGYNDEDDNIFYDNQNNTLLVQGGSVCDNVEDDVLLRPYIKCAYFKKLKDFFKQSIEIPIPEQARVNIKNILFKRRDNLDDAHDGDKIISDDMIFAAYTICQIDVILYLHPNGLPLKDSFSCRLIEESRIYFELLDDMENYITRGFSYTKSREIMIPLLQHINDKLVKHNDNNNNDNIDNEVIEKEMDAFFTHDTAIFNLIALLDILNLGDSPESSKASKFCPFSSRIVIEFRKCGLIQIFYNDVLVRYFHGVDEWISAYKSTLSTDTKTCCEVLPGEFD